jgi:hypothetical protein
MSKRARDALPAPAAAPADDADAPAPAPAPLTLAALVATPLADARPLLAALAAAEAATAAAARAARGDFVRAAHARAAAAAGAGAAAARAVAAEALDAAAAAAAAAAADGGGGGDERAAALAALHDFGAPAGAPAEPPLYAGRPARGATSGALFLAAERAAGAAPPRRDGWRYPLDAGAAAGALNGQLVAEVREALKRPAWPDRAFPAAAGAAGAPLARAVALAAQYDDALADDDAVARLHERTLEALQRDDF